MVAESPNSRDFDDVPFEEVEHTADWSFRVKGHDLPQLFVNAAHALSAMQPEESGEGRSVTREVQVEGVDRETLLVNWLNELLHLEHSNREAYHEFEVLEMTDTHLRTRIRGHSSPQARTPIKAVTFHNLAVKQIPGGWEATLVMDV